MNVAYYPCGTLPLHVETGRWCRPVKPLDQRICRYYNQNKVHFLIECDIYNDLRVELFSKQTEFNTGLPDFNANGRFCFIMNCTPYFYYALAKLVFTMHDRIFFFTK